MLSGHFLLLSHDHPTQGRATSESRVSLERRSGCTPKSEDGQAHSGLWGTGGGTQAQHCWSALRRSLHPAYVKGALPAPVLKQHLAQCECTCAMPPAPRSSSRGWEVRSVPQWAAQVPGVTMGAACYPPPSLRAKGVVPTLPPSTSRPFRGSLPPPHPVPEGLPTACGERDDDGVNKGLGRSAGAGVWVPG